MKKLIALTLLLCAVPWFARGDKADDLALQIKITRGERSKDSYAATTTLTLSGKTLIYRATSGRRLGGRATAPREFKLTDNDQRMIVELIRSRNLLRTETIERERPQEESGIYFYFDLSIEAAVNQSKGFVQIKGSRKASDLKEEKLYKDAVALIEELYAIIHRTDEAIVYEPLIH
jgi:hypothetical protein